MSRLDKLIARERDGEITPLEREELDRLARLDPAVRRDRAHWDELERHLAAPVSLGALRSHRLAARVASEVRGRRPPFRIGVPWVVALAACSLMFVVTLDDGPPEPDPGVVQVPPAHSPRPVEVRFHEMTEGDPEPVDIRF